MAHGLGGRTFFPGTASFPFDAVDSLGLDGLDAGLAPGFDVGLVVLLPGFAVDLGGMVCVWCGTMYRVDDGRDS